VINKQAYLAKKLLSPKNPHSSKILVQPGEINNTTARNLNTDNGSKEGGRPRTWKWSIHKQCGLVQSMTFTICVGKQWGHQPIKYNGGVLLIIAEVENDELREGVRINIQS